MNRRDIFRMFTGAGALAGIPKVKQVERLAMGDNDIIVLKFPNHLGMKNMACIREHMAHEFPNRRVLILEGGADISVISPGSATNTAFKRTDLSRGDGELF